MSFVLPEKDKWNTPDGAQYDPGFVAYLGLIFDPARNVVDVGANVGKVTRFLAQRTRRTVYSFEPAPSTFEALKANTRDLDNVQAFNVALGARGGVGAFIGDGTVTGHLSEARRGATVDVKVSTLHAAIPRVDIGLLKIDVEGGEMNVLKGAAPILTRCRPLIAMEVIDAHLSRGGTSRAALFSFLRGFGYLRSVNKYGMPETPQKPTGAADVFFLPDPSWWAPRLHIGYERLREKGKE